MAKTTEEKKKPPHTCITPRNENKGRKQNNFIFQEKLL